MAVFTSPVLDNFNRAESPLSTGYFPSAVFSPGNNPRRLAASGTQAVNQVGNTNGTSVWGTPLSQNQEAYLTIPTSGLVANGLYRLYGCIQNPGTTSMVGYAVEYDANSSGNGWVQMFVQKIGDPTNFLPLSAVAPPPHLPGTGVMKIGIRVYAHPWGQVVVEGWSFDGVSTWYRDAALADNNFGTAPLNSGYIGLGLGVAQFAAVDDFGGGNITAPTYLDGYLPGVNGALPDPLSDGFEGRVNGLPPSTSSFIAARQDPLSDRVEQNPAATAQNPNTVSPLSGGISVG